MIAQSTPFDQKGEEIFARLRNLHAGRKELKGRVQRIIRFREKIGPSDLQRESRRKIGGGRLEKGSLRGGK